MILPDLRSPTEAGFAKTGKRFPRFAIMLGKRSASVLVALKLLLQGQQLGERRVRIRLFVAARRLIGAPGSRLPIVVTTAAITVALAPRTTIATVLTRRPIAALRTTLGASLLLRPIRPLLLAGFAFVGLAFVRFGFDGLPFGRLAVGILARTTIAATVARTAVTFLALAIGRRRCVGGDGLAVRSSSARTLTCGLAFGRRCCGALVMTAAAAAPFGVAGAAFTLRTAGAPDLDHFWFGGRCGNRIGRRGCGFSPRKFNGWQQRLGYRRRFGRAIGWNSRFVRSSLRRRLDRGVFDRLGVRR